MSIDLLVCNYTMTMRYVRILLIITATALVAVTISCGGPADSVSRSIIQVKMRSFKTGKLEQASNGIAFKDETHALAVIDYEKFSPESIVVVTGENQTFEASIESVDPRSGLAILKTKGAMNLPPIPAGEFPGKGEPMVTWQFDWQGRLVSQSAIVTFSTLEPPHFMLKSKDYFGSWVDAGTVVINEDGKVTGLVIPYIDSPVHARVPGGTPPIVASVADTQKMLSGEYVREPWASGPAVISLASAVAHRGILMPPDDYEKSSRLIAELMGRLGEPVTATDFNISVETWSIRPDNHILIALYPKPMELRNTEGILLAQANWVAIQWDRLDGLPNRMIYGTVPYETQGAFKLSTDITSLEELVSGISDKY